MHFVAIFRTARKLNYYLSIGKTALFSDIIVIYLAELFSSFIDCNVSKLFMTDYSPRALVDTVVEGIQEKKGINIVVLDLGNIESAICSYFVICEGSSSTHVEAVADSVEEVVRVKMGEKPLRTEGYDTSQWIIHDYVDVVVHVFQRQVRQYYSLEELWDDAVRTEIENVF